MKFDTRESTASRCGMNTTLYSRCGTLIVVIAALAGCATNDVNLAYRPEPGHRSTLSAVKPLVFAIQVDDQREAADRDRVALRWKGGLAETRIKATREVTLVLMEALTAELENNDHHVRPQGDASVNAALHFALKKYWCCEIRVLGAFESVHAAATMQGNIDLFDARNERLMSKPISSTYLNVLSKNAVEFEPMLNGVLSEFIRNLARDPDVVTALRGIRAGSKQVSRP
jgi:uncharacterized lipoprotein YajG